MSTVQSLNKGCVTECKYALKNAQLSVPIPSLKEQIESMCFFFHRRGRAGEHGQRDIWKKELCHSR